MTISTSEAVALFLRAAEALGSQIELIGWVADWVGDYLVTLFKPPPPVGAGGGYMFSGRPSVPLSVRL